MYGFDEAVEIGPLVEYVSDPSEVFLARNSECRDQTFTQAQEEQVPDEAPTQSDA